MDAMHLLVEVAQRHAKRVRRHKQTTLTCHGDGVCLMRAFQSSSAFQHTY